MLVNANALRIPLADNSVHCCVTSPPYFGLRDYGITGQLGLEPTVEDYVANMVAVFREVRRVLREDGTCWVNLGDSYANYDSTTLDRFEASTLTKSATDWVAQAATLGRCKVSDGLKRKDLIGVPWRVAFALQADGWWLRSDCIWAKPNPMPESVTDRPTKAHEYIFLLSKAERYYYDAEAIAEPAKVWTGQAAVFERTGPVSEHIIPGQSAAQHRANRNGHNAFRGQGANRDGDNGPALRPGRDMNDIGEGATRNRRSVWTVATQPYSGAHFATWPEELVKPMILAGTSARGVCPVCGAPWERETDRAVLPPPDRINNNGFKHDAMTTHGEGAATLRNIVQRDTTGWRPTCTHDAAPVPAVVLDPFIGSGTTGAVAVNLGRRFVGLDLSRPYLTLAQRRVGNAQPALFGV